MNRASVRERWYTEIIKTRLVSGSCRELLALMAVRHMSERGYVKVSRETLAAELDVHPQRITVRIGEATRAGLLVKVSGGYNGQTAQYAAQLPPRKGVASRQPSSAEGNGKTTTSERQPSAAVPALAESRKVVAERQPYDAHAHAHVTYRHREQEPAPDDGRADREHRLMSQAGNYGSWLPTPVAADLATAESESA